MNYGHGGTKYQITKTYEWVDPVPKDACWKEVARTYVTLEGREHDQGRCGKRNCHYAVVVTTTTVTGKTIRNRMGFCREHLPTKYRNWFRPLLETVARVADRLTGQTTPASGA